MSLIETINFIATTTDSLFSKEVIIALIAAYIGARATSKATTKAHEFAIAKSKSDEDELTRNTLKLIKVELMTAWDIYILEYGNDLLNSAENTPITEIFPIGENPFPIYDSAPSCLANIDPLISANIVRIYMRTKGLISMINLNNSDCQTIKNAARFATQELVKSAIKDGVSIDEESAARLNQYYDFYVQQEAQKLEMGNTANGMRSLTIELRDLISVIEHDLNRLTSQ